jgi:hypothetical protein
MGTTPHKTKVISSNPPSHSCVDMSKKKKVYIVKQELFQEMNMHIYALKAHLVFQCFIDQ